MPAVPENCSRFRPVTVAPAAGHPSGMRSCGRNSRRRCRGDGRGGRSRSAVPGPDRALRREQIVRHALRLGDAVAIRLQSDALPPGREVQRASARQYWQVVVLPARDQGGQCDVQRQFAADRPIAGDAHIDEEIGKLLEDRGHSGGCRDALGGGQLERCGSGARAVLRRSVIPDRITRRRPEKTVLGTGMCRRIDSSSSIRQGWRGYAATACLTARAGSAREQRSWPKGRAPGTARVKLRQSVGLDRGCPVFQHEGKRPPRCRCTPNDLDPEDQVGRLAGLQAFRSWRTCTPTLSTAIPGSYIGTRQYGWMRCRTSQGTRAILIAVRVPHQASRAMPAVVVPQRSIAIQNCFSPAAVRAPC